MILLFRSSPLVLGLLLRSTAIAAEPVVSLPLDAAAVHSIAVGRDRITTIQFPGAISELHARSVSGRASSSSQFALSVNTNHPAIVSVHALHSGAEDNLNVVYAGQVYVLALSESNQPSSHVNLVIPPRSRPTGPARDGHRRRLRTFDLAKHYSLLRAQHPALVAQVERSQPRQTFRFHDCDVILEQVLRFPAEDTLAFHCLLQNKTDQELRYDPRSFGVQCGELLYPSSLSDGGGRVPPHATEQIIFLITGAWDGGPLNLSVNNQFVPLFRRSGKSTPSSKSP